MLSSLVGNIQGKECVGICLFAFPVFNDDFSSPLLTISHTRFDFYALRVTPPTLNCNVAIPNATLTGQVRLHLLVTSFNAKKACACRLKISDRSVARVVQMQRD